MNLNDPSLRRYCQLVLLGAALVMLAISAFASFVVVDWFIRGGAGSDNPAILAMADLLPYLSGPHSSDLQNIVTILGAAAPLVVAAVCFKGVADKRRLSRFGLAMLGLLSTSFVLAGLSYLWINPKDWEDGHLLELSGLLHVQLWARTVLSGSAFYIATLLGIKATP